MILLSVYILIGVIGMMIMFIDINDKLLVERGMERMNLNVSPLVMVLPKRLSDFVLLHPNIDLVVISIVFIVSSIAWPISMPYWNGIYNSIWTTGNASIAGGINQPRDKDTKLSETVLSSMMEKVYAIATQSIHAPTSRKDILFQKTRGAPIMPIGKRQIKQTRWRSMNGLRAYAPYSTFHTHVVLF